MQKIVLFNLQRRDIEISIQMFFNEKEQFYFDGYDSGKLVEEVWGTSDYEYSYTIEREEVNKLYLVLNLKKGDKSGLLHGLKTALVLMKHTHCLEILWKRRGLSMIVPPGRNKN